MSAEIFLACFLANLFAFIVFGVVGWQVASYFIHKGIKKHLPEMIAGAIHGGTGAPHGMDEEAQKALAELFTNAAKMPPGVIPHVGRVKCTCGATQDVPLEQNLEPFLKERGWHFESANYGWTCPACAGIKLSVA